MTAATVSRGARRFVAAGALFLVAWQALAVAGVSRRAQVALGLYGFVFHVAFGKAFSLIPSYFDRELAAARAPDVQVPLTLAGASALALGASRVGPPGLAAAGAVLWAAGVAVFLGAIAWTVRDNPTGAETGTSEANAERRSIDRLANGFVPVALAYLGAGAYETAAAATGLPTLFGGYAPRATHLLAAGAAALLVFAIGFRLLPRFLVATPPAPLVAVVLPTGAVGPVLIAASLPSGPVFLLGAALEATAMVGFAVAFLVLFVRSDRDRVGFYGVLVGAASGVVGVLLGLSFAVSPIRPGLALAHLRLNLLGFLGATVVGMTYQFYPPGVGTFPLSGDRTALVSIAAIGGGVFVEAAGLAVRSAPVALAGRLLALGGALLYAYLLFGLFYQRYYR